MPTTTSRSHGSTRDVPVEDGFSEPSPGLRTEHAGTLDDIRIAYSLAGPPGAPVVAVFGGISADRHVIGRGDRSGWWETMVGRGRPLDVDRYRVLSVDYLGGPGGSVLPVRGSAGNGASPDAVPLVTPRDQAAALAAVVEELGVGPLRGVIGASYGGAVALAFAADHPELAAGALVIGAAHRSHPLATAVREIQRRIVRRGLRRGEDAREALALARALAMTTYRSDREFEDRFSAPPALEGGTPRFPVEDYLDHQGEKFARRFSAREFLCLSQSLDLHVVEPEDVSAPVTLVSVDPDMLAPRWQVEELARRLGGPRRVVRLASRYGHDAFLVDHDAFAPVIGDFLRCPELDS